MVVQLRKRIRLATNNVAVNLLAYKNKHKLTTESLSRQLGMAPQRVGKIERAELGLLMGDLEAIAHVLKVKPSELV